MNRFIPHARCQDRTHKQPEPRIMSTSAGCTLPDVLRRELLKLSLPVV